MKFQFLFVLKKIDNDVTQEEIDSLLEELQKDGIKFEKIEIILPKIEYPLRNLISWKRTGQISHQY